MVLLTLAAVEQTLNLEAEDLGSALVGPLIINILVLVVYFMCGCMCVYVYVNKHFVSLIFLDMLYSLIILENF